MSSQVRHVSWFALKVAARSEARVKTALDAKDLEVFLPLRRSRAKWSDRTVERADPHVANAAFARWDEGLMKFIPQFAE